MAAGVQGLADKLKKAVDIARNGGIAKAAIYSGGSVVVDGKLMTAKIIVPITVQDGQKVYVQVSAGDNVAYVIG